MCMRVGKLRIFGCIYSTRFRGCVLWKFSGDTEWVSLSVFWFAFEHLADSDTGWGFICM
jgi:hypothetical protein